VISDLDVWRAVNLIQRYGRDADLEAAKRADLMLERGDSDGQLVWRRIRRAIVQFEAEPIGRPNSGRKFFWKIDYYDLAMEFGSEDPADPSKTGGKREEIVVEGLSKEAAIERCYALLEELPRGAVAVGELSSDGDIPLRRSRQLRLKF